MIMTGKKTFVRSLCQLFSLKSINYSMCHGTIGRARGQTGGSALGEQQHPCQASEMPASPALQMCPAKI